MTDDTQWLFVVCGLCGETIKKTTETAIAVAKDDWSEHWEKRHPWRTKLRLPVKVKAITLSESGLTEAEADERVEAIVADWSRVTHGVPWRSKAVG